MKGCVDMNDGIHHEIERKYLIDYPDLTLLEETPGREKWEITQIYLRETKPGLIRRIRRIVADGEVKYYKTFKRRISMLTAEESEKEITGGEYAALARESDDTRRPLLKTRYRVPYEGHILEFDIYPFWKDRAILEIELESEQETPKIPDCIRILRDVSDAPEYKNWKLAKEIPCEAIE